jgi:hypothetical protein
VQDVFIFAVLDGWEVMKRHFFGEGVQAGSSIMQGGSNGACPRFIPAVGFSLFIESL